MMKYLFLSVLSVLFLLAPHSALAENRADTLLIHEVSLHPVSNDQQWIELINISDSDIALDGWLLKNSVGDELPLFGVVQPDQLFVFTWENSFFGITDQIRLYFESNLEDNWEISQTSEEGQSWITDNAGLVLTDFPTAGRPNILQEDNRICEEPEIQVPEEPEILLESGDVQLSEIFANPEGDESSQEFIELYNNENRILNLHEWVIRDASKEFILQDILILPNNYLVLPRSLTGLALNNSNEEVRLIDPFQRELDTFAYASTSESLSWNTGESGEWYEAPPTPGQENVIPQEEDEPEEEPDKNEDEPAVVEENTFDENLARIRLSELLPNPEGSDSKEWIELINPTDSVIDLAGLLLEDTAKSYELPSIKLGPGEFHVIAREDSGIALNNSEETIRLRLDTEVIDEFYYESSTEAFSWAVIEEEWLETSLLTPGEENLASLENEPTHDDEDVQASSEKEPSAAPENAPRNISFADWKQIEDGENLVLSGIVNVLPETFASRSAYIQDPADEEVFGIELYFHKAEWPKLSIGDIIKVAGEKSVTSKGERLLVRSRDAIQLFGTAVVNEKDFSEAGNNSIVFIEGEFIEQSKNKLYLDVDGSEFTVILDKADISIEKIEENSLLSLTAFLPQKEEEVLWLRDISDLVIKESKNDDTVISSVQEFPSPSAPKKTFPIWTLILGIAGGALFTIAAMHGKTILQRAQSLLQLIRESQQV
jgi:hypothetical protein